MKPSREEMLAVTMNQKLAKQGVKTRKLAEARDVNTMPDPKTYAAVMGMLGVAPNEMGFSVAHPQYKQLMDVAEPAFYAGTAAQLAPFAKPAAAGVKATGRAVGQALNDRLLSGQSLTPGFNTPSPINFVVKPERGNWLGGNLMGNVDRSLDRLTPTNDLNAHINVLKAQLASAENRAGSAREIQNLKDDIADAQKDQAVNNWVKSNLGKYAKNQMATPSDPVRLLFEKRTQNVEAELARAKERVARMRERAAAEPDERRRANLMNNAAQAEAKAQNDYQLAIENVMHSGITPDLSAKDLAMERVAAGFQPKGMGQSRAAKNWEGAADESIRAYNAGAMQQAVNVMPELQNAERALKDYGDDLNKRFEEWVRSKSPDMDDKSVQALAKMPMSDKATLLKDTKFEELQNEYNRKLLMTSGPEWHYGQQNKWVEKLNPDTTLYSGDISDLGFGHVIDILRHDVREGRIRPDQLNKVTVEQAVQRAADYNLAQAKKNTDVNLKMSEGFPVHKEYPEGYKWIELATPKELPVGYSVIKDDMTGGFKVVDEAGKDAVNRTANQIGHINVPFHKTEESAIAEAMKYDKRLEEALKYEGDVMGHCVGTYCPDVAEGRSRIYSLRDPSGASRVTIEVQPQKHLDYNTWFSKQPEEIQNKIAERRLTDKNHNIYEGPEYLAARENLPPRIVQIKGSGKKDSSQRLRHEGTGYADNPDANLLPYVHDFVKSGQWSDVGDLQNAGLYSSKDVVNFIPKDFPMSRNARTLAIGRAKMSGDMPDYLTRAEYEELLKKHAPEDTWLQNSNPEEGMKDGGEVKMDKGGSMKATPVKNKEAHAMAKALDAIHGFASKPFGYNNPPGEMVSEFLGIPATARTLERIGYGEPLTTGKGMTTKPREDTMEALMSVAPLAPATKGLPVGAVVKPKGGNWFGNNVERELKSLKSSRPTHRDEALILGGRWAQDADTPEGIRAMAETAAINNWVDRNLTNYVKKEMATPEDPVRNLAEQGITHYPVAELPVFWARHGQSARQDFGGTQMAESPLAKQWENRADSMIMRDTAQQHQDMMHLAPGMYSDKDEWIKKLAPDTPLYSAQQNKFSSLDLGFDHIIDVLREDLASGRIRPEQLSKVSMEQAVRRTFDYDQELAKKMAEARIVAREGLPVYKEYPEGYRWVELNKPGAFASESEAMGHSVRGYEPPKDHPDWIEGSGDRGNLGYGHGGWEGIKSGRAKVYSLVDPKGEPHVTVEIGQTRGLSQDEAANKAREEGLRGKAFAERVFDLMEGKDLPSTITQIKGKQNAAPKEEYLPYVQDFVQSGNWSDVGDLRNAGLRDINSRHNIQKYLQEKGIEAPRYVPEKQYLEYEDSYLMDQLYPPDQGMKDGGEVKMGIGGLLGKGARAMKGSESAQLKALREEFAARDAVIKAQQALDEKKYLKDIEANTLTPESIQKKLDEQKLQGLFKGGEVKMGIGGLLGKGAKAAQAEKARQAMKASEALGQHEGKNIYITQTDRTKVGEGFLGGPGFSGLQHTSDPHREAMSAWGVKNPGTAKTILGGDMGKDPLFSTMIGSPTQHQSNQMVFDKMYRQFKNEAKKGNLTDELRFLINDKLAKAVDKEGKNIFPPNVDILGKDFHKMADTFDRRSIAGHLMGGVSVGGKKGQIIDYDKIIKQTTDPNLIDAPSGAIGNRLFTLSGEVIQRPDLHPAFPTIMTGEDMGLMYNPVPRELFMQDFINKVRAEKGRDPGYMDYTRGRPPSQFISEGWLTKLQKEDHKKGGLLKVKRKK
jgi:hypothetical protein